MRRLVALVAVALAVAGCASHHGSVNAASTKTPAAHASTSQPAASHSTTQKSSTKSTSPAGISSPTHGTSTTSAPTTHQTSTAAPSYSYQMSGVLPDVFPGGTGNSSTSDVTVTQAATSSGQVFSYPTSNGRLAVLLDKTSSGWFKAGDGNSTNPRNCAWSPQVQDLANSGSWHVDSTCTVTTAGSSTTLHLVEDAAIVGTGSIVVGGRTLTAHQVHRTGTLTISGSGSTSTTNFTQDLWWLADRGVLAKANSHNTTKQTSVLSSTTTTTTGSLSLVSIR